jgi:serpin B
VVHKSVVAVDEKGTEAAAATVALMELKGIPQKEKEFVADHPFLFAIADLKTETVLFLGRVANPAK